MLGVLLLPTLPMELSLNVQSKVTVDVVPPILPGQAFFYSPAESSMEYNVANNVSLRSVEMVNYVPVAYVWRIRADNATLDVVDFVPEAQALLHPDKFKSLQASCARFTLKFKVIK